MHFYAIEGPTLYSFETVAITSRQEAIDWLLALGLYAREHNLWLGPAIAVSRKPAVHGDITVLENNTLIHPTETGGWSVTRYAHGGGVESQPYATLESAVRAASELVGADQRPR